MTQPESNEGVPPVSNLDPEEQEILDAYRMGELKPVLLSSEEIERYRDAARAVTRKDNR